MKNKSPVIIILAINLCFSVLAFAQPGKKETGQEFEALKADFEDEISYPPYSNYTFTNKYWDSESGRNIIAMGKRALPFIMEEIKNGKSWFTVAAQRITGIRMRGPTAQDLSEEWLDWWEENKDNPEWNVFLIPSTTEQGSTTNHEIY